MRQPPLLATLPKQTGAHCSPLGNLRSAESGSVKVPTGLRLSRCSVALWVLWLPRQLPVLPLPRSLARSVVLLLPALLWVLNTLPRTYCVRHRSKKRQCVQGALRKTFRSVRQLQLLSARQDLTCLGVKSSAVSPRHSRSCVPYWVKLVGRLRAKLAKSSLMRRRRAPSRSLAAWPVA